MLAVENVGTDVYGTVIGATFAVCWAPHWLTRTRANAERIPAGIFTIFIKHSSDNSSQNFISQILALLCVSSYYNAIRCLVKRFTGNRRKKDRDCDSRREQTQIAGS